MKTHKNQNGAVLLEFVLVLPLLLLLLFASIEFGVAFFNKAMITNASREAARAAIVFNTDGTDRVPIPPDEISEIVANYCDAHLITFGAANTAVVAYAPPATPVSGDPITVTVSYDYGFLIVPNFIPGFKPTIKMEGVSVMRYE